ncbi:MAG: hypothetical protein H6918_08015 [Sphingomonadaceae bacterium]|nr:hypothetical protein [Sphingomonadaceae bacterium]
MFTKRLLSLIVLLASVFAAPSYAQDRDVPYWASIRFDEVNLRVGPSEQYRIDWVYKRRGLPVVVVRVVEGWRLVRDPDGAQGWIAQSQLHPDRSAIVVGDGPAAMRDAPADNGKLKWNAQPGVVGKLGDCQLGWCEFNVGGRIGWVQAARLWGAGEP